MLTFKSLQTKTIFWVALTLILTAGIIVSFSFFSMRSQALETAKEQFQILAQEDATRVQVELARALDTVRTLAQVLSKVRDSEYPIDIPRSDAVALLRSVLEENAQFINIFTVWEPDAYDGFDLGYADEQGHDSSGRFAPFLQKKDHGEIELKSLLDCLYHSPDGKLGTWYSNPKSTGLEHVHSPFVHEGCNHEQILVLTAAVPIRNNNTFYGVVGVDLNANFIQAQIDSESDFSDSLQMAFIAQDAVYVAYKGQSGRTGQPIGPEHLQYQEIIDRVSQGENIDFIADNYLQVFAPVPLGNTGHFWTLHLKVPIHVVTSEVTQLMWQQMMIFAAILGVMIFLAFLGARNITRPLALLLEGVKRVGKGDLAYPVEIDSRDEIGTFATVFNSMRKNLQTSLVELEEHQRGLEKKVAYRTEQLQEKNQEIESHRLKLKNALEEISLLFLQVIKDGNFGSYYSAPMLQSCWEAEKCQLPDCPCFGREQVRCWQVRGTLCNGTEQAAGFAQQKSDCEQCDFYRQTTADPIFLIGEQFNKMMHVLEENNLALEDAYQQLQQSQATILQQEKLASIGQLAAGVAHEINNPIGFVKSNLSSLNKYQEKLVEYFQLQDALLQTHCAEDQLVEVNARKKKLKIDFIIEDAKDLVAESLDGVERVRVIVQNLKNFSRVDQAEQTRVNINDCIDDTLNIIWNELKYKTTLKKDYGELPLTLCYPQQLNQVFMNLLVNAAQAIEEKGEIEIKTYAAEEYIYIQITDTGNGISEENLPKLFEPFFTTKEVGQGTGLGLSIVYDIITKQHYGEITATSEVGKGTTFTLKIPVTKGDTDELLAAEIGAQRV